VSDKDTHGTEFLAAQVALDLNETINLFHENDAETDEFWEQSRIHQRLLMWVNV